MVKTAAARRELPRRAVRKGPATGESPRALYQPGSLQRAVVECSGLAAALSGSGRVWVRRPGEPR